jgi:hypothetical protein
LKKYFNSISDILSFIYNFIGESKVLEKYFNFYLNESIFEIDSDIPIENNEKESGFSIYCYLIYAASLIIKKLLTKNFSNFCQRKITFLNKNDYNANYLIIDCFSFLSKLFIEIPLKYEEISERKEKIKNQNKKKKNNNKKKEKEKDKEEELDEDLKHYYINIINNIKINDLMKLSTLLDNNRQINSEKEILSSQLRKFLIFLNHIENDYNLMHKESNIIDESQDSNLCPICLDKENDVHVSPCDHSFCFNCISSEQSII